MIICFCRPGVMAECTARGHADQRRCKFYAKATVAERCMFYDPNLETCWTPAAADYVRGIINHEEPPEEEDLQDYPIDDYIESPHEFTDEEEELTNLIDLINGITTI
jgi:hypothetical protein